MNIMDAYPSTYLKAADIKGHEIPVKLSHVNMEQVGDGDKPVLYFIGKSKGLVLNKTNAEILHTIYGDETDEWRGKPAVLATAPVLFQGKRVDGITVRVSNTAAHDDEEAPF